MKCIRCGKKSGKNKYCSNRCSRLTAMSRYHKKQKADGKPGKNARNIYRQLIVNTLGNECSECGETKNLHIHHKKTLYAGGLNIMDNVILLCNPCHIVTHQENGDYRKCK